MLLNGAFPLRIMPLMKLPVLMRSVLQSSLNVCYVRSSALAAFNAEGRFWRGVFRAEGFALSENEVVLRQ